MELRSVPGIIGNLTKHTPYCNAGRTGIRIARTLLLTRIAAHAVKKPPNRFKLAVTDGRLVLILDALHRDIPNQGVNNPP